MRLIKLILKLTDKKIWERRFPLMRAVSKEVEKPVQIMKQTINR